jgi:hypothetical protein
MLFFSLSLSLPNTPPLSMPIPPLHLPNFPPLPLPDSTPPSLQIPPSLPLPNSPPLPLLTPRSLSLQSSSYSHAFSSFSSSCSSFFLYLFLLLFICLLIHSLPPSYILLHLSTSCLASLHTFLSPLSPSLLLSIPSSIPYFLFLLRSLSPPLPLSPIFAVLLFNFSVTPLCNISFSSLHIFSYSTLYSFTSSLFPSLPSRKEEFSP